MSAATATTARYQAVPAELRSRPQWVCWKLVERDGQPKPTKEPWQPDGRRRASSTDPSTWSRFEEAAAALEAGSFDGLGYVFSADDPYVGVDLDDGLTEADRAAIMVALDSYTEMSVSGSGVHVIVRANLNGYGRNRRGPFEVYEHGRYFVVTGNHLRGTPTTIEPRQAKLDEVLEHFLPWPPAEKDLQHRPAQPVDLDDRDLLDRAMRAKNGADFNALYGGRWEDRYPSRSEADLALCNALAFWTGRDPKRINEIFRSSGLYREKWERADYRARTIETAIEGCSETFSPRPATSSRHDLVPRPLPLRGGRGRSVRP
ncbi:MAG: hypothetical protein WKF41_05895 [Gaiellaceae bacterium]